MDGYDKQMKLEVAYSYPQSFDTYVVQTLWNEVETVCSSLQSFKKGECLSSLVNLLHSKQILYYISTDSADFL